MIFQSVGTNYSFADTVKQLFTVGTKHHSEQLKAQLEADFGGTAVLYSKGRNALSEAVKLVAEGQSVAVNAMTCSVVIEAIKSADATPCYIDISPKTAHFTAETLSAQLKTNPNIKAVIVQNTYGHPCDIAAIEKVTATHGVAIIEDLAHSLGQTYDDGRKVGTVGALAMLSFGRDKIIDAANGGALIVRDTTLLRHLDAPQAQPSISNQLHDRYYPFVMWLVRMLYPIYIGKVLHAAVEKLHIVRRSASGGINRNHTLPRWQARRVLALYNKLDENLTHRTSIVTYYREHLKSIMLAPNSLVRAALLVNDQKEFWQIMDRHGIFVRDTWYDTPVGPAREYATLNYPEKSYPNAVKCSHLVINLPTHRSMTIKRAAKLVEVIQKEVLQ